MGFLDFFYMNHARRILHRVADEFRKKQHKLSVSLQDNIRSQILTLQEAIDQNEVKQARQLSKELEKTAKKQLQNPFWKRILEGTLALLFALVVATLIRQMWFELYEIPTGSMRPTFKEQDHLTVSKTQFGINRPLETDHLYFDPALVQRTGTIIFTGDKLPVINSDTHFLGILPYKKRYVKRLIGKPEDQFTFYGGQLFAWDKDQQPLDELRNAPWMKSLEHIPFMNFEGVAKQINRQTIYLYYFNKPYGRILIDDLGVPKGEVFDGTQWVEDDVATLMQPHEGIKSLSEILGIGNYAMGQIFNEEELKKEGLQSSEKGILYLILRHTPNLDFKIGTAGQRIPKLFTTVIPLQSEDLKSIMNNMYTARFTVENGKAKRYSYEDHGFSKTAVSLDIPNGTYEFYYGKAYEVHFGGITKELAKDHPIYKVTPERTQLFYNLGIDWDQSYMPTPKSLSAPHRYVYFRGGDLYLLGAPFIHQDNPRLKKFVEEELAKQAEASPKKPYIAFIDHGAPTTIPLDAKGIKLPKDNYLVLGDNHAMSSDSRIFGFVPSANLQGVPDLIFWPIGDRLGRPEQKPYPILVKPRLIVWSIAGLIALVSYLVYCYRIRKRVEVRL